MPPSPNTASETDHELPSVKRVASLQLVNLVRRRYQTVHVYHGTYVRTYMCTKWYGGHRYRQAGHSSKQR